MKRTSKGSEVPEAKRVKIQKDDAKLDNVAHNTSKEIVNSNLVQYLLQTDIQKRTEKMQWQIQTLHRDFSPGNPNRENQHILY
jgi:hypothetical protein